MGEIISVLPCVFKVVELTIEELVDIRMKMKENNNTVAMDLARLLENSKKYSKKDRHVIRAYVKLWLEQSGSANGSVADIS